VKTCTLRNFQLFEGKIDPEGQFVQLTSGYSLSYTRSSYLAFVVALIVLWLILRLHLADFARESMFQLRSGQIELDRIRYS
jgi:hypothetical protein